MPGTASALLPAVEAFRWLVTCCSDALIVTAADADDARALAAARGIGGPAYLTPVDVKVRRATERDLAVFAQLERLRAQLTTAPAEQQTLL